MEYPISESLATKLESLVDSYGLRDIACALQDICDEKAEHLRANWQDNESAKGWDKAAAEFGKLDKALSRIF